MKHLKARYTVERTERAGVHYYAVKETGGVYKGATTFLSAVAKPYLVPWAAKMTAQYLKNELIKADRMLIEPEIDDLCYRAKKQHNWIKEKTADIGTRAHECIDRIIKGEDYEITPDIKNSVEEFLRWRDHSRMEIVLGDTKIASQKYEYGGSLDALGYADGEFVIIDFKTSNQFSKEYAYQVAAYGQAFQETFGEEINRMIILRIGRDEGEFEVREVVNPVNAFKSFLCAKWLYLEGLNDPYKKIIYDPPPAVITAGT